MIVTLDEVARRQASEGYRYEDGAVMPTQAKAEKLC
jgi:hypothetical protein